MKNREKHVDKHARINGAELTGNPEPENEKSLKVGNISRFLKVNIIEKYKVTDK